MTRPAPSLFLDKNPQYTCYFASPDEDVDRAGPQARLHLQKPHGPARNSRFGCGWGGALSNAAKHMASGDGVACGRAGEGASGPRRVSAIA
jgi:cyclopropane fatty-acyl-phospholipid synthase-like methyltransferase